MSSDNGFSLAKHIAELGKSFSKEQKDLLLEIHDEIEAKGATKEQLAPLSGLIFLNWGWIPSEKDIERAKELAEKYKW